VTIQLRSEGKARVDVSGGRVVVRGGGGCSLIRQCRPGPRAVLAALVVGERLRRGLRSLATTRPRGPARWWSRPSTRAKAQRRRSAPLLLVQLDHADAALGAASTQRLQRRTRRGCLRPLRRRRRSP
jgi:hypothetical protein